MAVVQSPANLFKLLLHFLAAILVIWYSARIFVINPNIAYLAAFVGMVLFLLPVAQKYLAPFIYLSSWVLFLAESIVLGIIAWYLYHHDSLGRKVTFFYEGASVFYFGLAALALYMRKRRVKFVSYRSESE